MKTTLEIQISAAREAGQWTGELWHVEPFQPDQGKSLCVCQPMRGIIATIHADDCGDFDRDADEENARLLAAAPALHFALATLQANPNDPRAHRVALDALALLSGKAAITPHAYESGPCGICAICNCEEAHPVHQ